MMYGQNALVSINFDCCFACAWLHKTNIKSLRFFMSDGLSSLNLRAAIRGHRRMFFLLGIEMFSLPYSKIEWTPATPSPLAKGSCVLGPAILIRLFYNTPNIPGSLDPHVLLSTLCTSLPASPMTSQPCLQPQKPSFHQPSFQIPPHVPFSLQPFLIPLPEMICPLALYSHVSFVQYWMYERKVGLCLWALPCINQGYFHH